MARKTLIYKALGLFTFPNQYAAPSGAMASATDVFLDRGEVVEARRKTYTFDTQSLDATYTGLERCFTGFSGTSNPQLIRQEFKVSGTTHTFGSIFGTSAKWNTDPGGQVLSTFDANNNCYVTCGGAVSASAICANGATIRYTTPAGDALTRGCGMPEAPTPTHYYKNKSSPGPDGYLNSTPGTAPDPGSNQLLEFTDSASTVFEYQRAYRVLFQYTDTNGNLVRGAPSGRHIVWNPGTTDYGIQVFGIGNLLAGDVVQLYASEIQWAIQTPSGGTAVANSFEPSDDMRLVYEHVVIAGDISQGFIGINDITPDALRGAALYTNDTQQGILQAEQPPPPSAYATYFKNVAWYAGVLNPGFSYITLNIIGLDGWSSGGTPTTISVNGVTYTANATEDLANAKFCLFTTSGTLSPAQALFNTARSITRAINYNNGTELAVFASPPNATAATIYIKLFVDSNTVAGSGTSGSQGWALEPFSVISAVPLSSVGCIKTAHLPAGTTSPDISSGKTGFKTSPTAARLYYSKPSQPEAVPENNYIVVGSPSIPINGIGWLRDSLFVFKSEGLFRVTGTTAFDIKIELFDATVKMSPGQFTTISASGNQLFALTNQGVVAVTESGTSIISRQIEDLVVDYTATYPNSVALSVPGSLIASARQLQSYWPSFGFASETERKYFLVLQGNDGAASPTWSPAYSPTILAYNFVENAWVYVSPPAATSVCGGGVFQRIGVVGYGQDIVVFTRNNSAITSAIVQYGNPLNISPAYVTSPTVTYCNVTPQSAFAGGTSSNPLVLKRFQDVKIGIAGTTAVVSAMAVTFSSDSGASPVTQTVVPTTNNQVVNIQVPQDHAVCGNLTVQISATTDGGKFLISAVSVSYDEISDRTAK